MLIDLKRIYRISSVIYIFVSVILGFLFFARGYSGYTYSQVKLALLCDLALSSGFFLIGLPLLVSMNLSEGMLSQNRSQVFQKINLLVQFLGFALSLFFVFGFDNTGYVGFIQLPENGAVFYLASLCISVLFFLLFLIERILSVSGSLGRFVSISVFLSFSICGLGFSLIVFQAASMFFEFEQLYFATVPVFEFLRQLILVMALSSFIIRLMNQIPMINQKFKSVLCGFSGLFLLLGFQTTGLNSVGGDLLFVANQIVSFLGVLGFVYLSSTLLFYRWKSSVDSLIESGVWVAHLVFASCLILTVVLQVGAGKIFLASGALDSLRLVLLVFIVPLVCLRTEDHQLLHSKVNRSLVAALSWCGLFLIVSSMMVLAPYGGALIFMNYDAFRAMYGISMTGMFMFLVSGSLILWDKVLSETI